jgi:DNA-directed RNA polymerase subunit RPC12/RpoP
MPIHIVCPDCQKKLKAKDELAGNRVKCPGCGRAILVPAMSAAAEVTIDLSDSFAGAVDRGDAAEIARLFLKRDLTLVKAPDDSGDGGASALTAEIDETPMVVAFTAEEPIRAFAEAVPDLLDADGTLPAFGVSGADFLSNLPDGFGVLLNPESDDSTVIPPDLIAAAKQAAAEQPRAAPQTPEARRRLARSKSVRQDVLARLEAAGFRPANWLPLSDFERTVRSPAEIASRLMGLAAVFAWVSAPADVVPADRVRDYVKKNRLRSALTEAEIKILSTPRSQAREEHVDSIGWRLENMWPLAWALGFEAEPTIEAAHIEDKITRAILGEVIDWLNRDLDEVLAQAEPRSADEVLALEDRFYCAHNAVRSAQLGRETVPEDFHPVIHGGAVHERRHSLTWCVSADTPWDETDLST